MKSLNVITIVKVLSSGFLLNGIGAFLGFLKMGLVAYNVSKNELVSFFLYLAIWSLFASLGEAVRQGARQVDHKMNTKTLRRVAKFELLQIVPFAIFIVVACYAIPRLNFVTNFSDLFLTMIAGYLFSITSYSTGLLESKGQLSLANLVSLISQLFVFPAFIYTAKYLDFSLILCVYFLMNLVPGFLHGILFAREYFSSSEKTYTISTKENFAYKKIIFYESFLRFLIPMLLTVLSSNEEMLKFSILIKLFIIYSIYTVSVIPISSISSTYSIESRTNKFIELIGWLIFVSASTVLLFFSRDIIRILSNSNLEPDLFDWFFFLALGAASIFTQPSISKIGKGNLLFERESAAKKSLLINFLIAIPSIFFFGATGGLMLLLFSQGLYYIYLRRWL